MTRADQHEKIVINVHEIDGTYVEQVVRTVMSDEGKRTIKYKHQVYQVKKMTVIEGVHGDVYVLKLSPKSVNRK
jgi:hypothetical protein